MLGGKDILTKSDQPLSFSAITTATKLQFKINLKK